MKTEPLDRTFAALAHPARRAILARLSEGPASVTDLCRPFDLSQPAVSKHLRVLEQAGLVARGRDAQWRPREIKLDPLREASLWIDTYNQLWEKRLDRLDNYVQTLKSAKTDRLATTDRSSITEQADNTKATKSKANNAQAGKTK